MMSILNIIFKKNQYYIDTINNKEETLLENTTKQGDSKEKNVY
jgi:hypothetical protein